jgi:epoxide hydrolase-like predicted phosphatase
VPGRFDAVLFDFGGVYTNSPFATFESAALELGADPGLVHEIVFGSYDRDTDHPWHRLERGEVSLVDAREAIVELAAARGIELDPIDILARTRVGGGAREAMVSRTRSLRAEGYATALVTNNAREFGVAWRAVLPLDELFDVVIDSSEVGVRKPDPAIFQRALDSLGGVAAERSVFLDDFPGNVEAARRLGMRGVVVGEDLGAALAELDRLLAG